ncbi:dihydropteroate synthase [Rickettsiales endosymbiont of Stachyamoeba lipophora]|uniref:dihydropteroate synthase n=1 Tax=Rickettsiales endosymbiont of Stachyamoeba lipophora TaxID=2486578 RepID=UPI000F64C85E|nr:dihydropteroate synthase [Rickettsiales endosymbiont of Stachyamoeba lipophora]AZL16205.1 dihydropteroate synthase [Rickettsiales endosymbiont of Stachyamoeba lipophora]
MTKFFAILNLTPDSFSDGNKFVNYDQALTHTEQLIKNGAYAIDIGAESTRPGAVALTAQEEITRLTPILPDIKLLAATHNVKISLDTYHPETAEYGINLGVHYINDVSGGNNPKMIEVIASSNVDYIIMHNLGIPPDKQKIIDTNHNPIEVISKFFLLKIATLVKNNIAFERIIIDPGLGFGNSPAQALQIIKEIKNFKNLGCRILVGHSRKSFFTKLTKLASHERDIETLAVSSYLSSQGVDYLRVHNLSLHHRFFTTLEKII